MEYTLEGYYNMKQLPSGIEFLVRWLLYAIKEDIDGIFDKIQKRYARLLTLTEEQEKFMKAYRWVANMDVDTFILDFISTLMYLRAGFTKLPATRLYYDITEHKSWAYIHFEDFPEGCYIFNVRAENKLYHQFNHARPFDNWHTLPFTILHELCHLISIFIDSKARKDDKPQSEIIRLEWQKVSRYGATNYCEYCAESILYLFGNNDYIPKQYLRYMPQVSDQSHPAFAIPYSNLKQNGYRSQYDYRTDLITPEKLINDYTILSKHEKWSTLDVHEKDIEWAAKNYYQDAAAMLTITLICWYVNEVYDRLPPINLHKLSLMI